MRVDLLPGDEPLANEFETLPLVKRISRSYVQSYMETVVMAGLDGIATIIVVIAACIGVQLGLGVLLILSLSKLGGGAVELTIQNLVSSYQDRTSMEKLREKEKKNYQKSLEYSQQRMRKMWESKGLDESQAKELTNLLSKNQQAFVDTMVEDERFELKETKDEGRNPLKHALYTFIAFLLLGFTPILAYCLYVVIETNHKAGSLGANITFGVSLGLTVIVLALMGAMKAKVLKKPVLSTLVITISFALLSGSVSFFIGYALQWVYEYDN